MLQPFSRYSVSIPRTCAVLPHQGHLGIPLTSLHLLAVVGFAVLHLATSLAEDKPLLEFFALFLEDTTVCLFLFLFHISSPLGYIIT